MKVINLVIQLDQTTHQSEPRVIASIDDNGHIKEAEPVLITSLTEAEQTGINSLVDRFK